MGRLAILFALLLALTYFYLYPGSQALLEGRTDVVMSDGTDPASLPYGYDAIIKVWQEHPSRFFYGAVYTDVADPEQGRPIWFPWNERFIAVLSHAFVPVEQISTAVVVCLLLLNGIAMYLLSTYLGWGWPVSYGLAIAWAFNAYTRARAKVHMALAGIYHLPLIFLGLFLVVRGRSKRSLLAAAMCFLMAGSVAHYYILTSMVLSPLFLIFLMFQPEFRSGWKKILLRMSVAILPLVAFLGWNFVARLPSDAKISADESIHGGYAAADEYKMNRIYLGIFYARPIDYLSGDLSLELNGFDLNPLRAEVNSYIINHLDNSNPHERSAGIRWIILGLSIAAFFALARGKVNGDPKIRNNLLFFTLFALFTALASFSPDFPFPDWGLSYFIYSIIPKIRVSMRESVNVHFALLMISGFFLSLNHLRWRKFFWMPGLFALLMILDYPPIQHMPMAQLLPPITDLQRENGPCGMGMVFPFVNYFNAPELAYQATQKFRGSDCPILNIMNNMSRAKWMEQRFPPNGEFIARLAQLPQVGDELERWARCVPLNWIWFHPAVSKTWAEGMCHRLGWKFTDDQSCIAPKKDQPLRQYPDQCR